MTTDVLRLQGNYLVQSSLAGQITLDTTAGANITGASNSTGTVVVTGNLVVYGDTTFGSVTNNVVENMNITDNLITLNSGELATSYPLGRVTAGGGYSGIKIARGKAGAIDSDSLAAFIEWNDRDDSHWQGFGAIQTIQGLFEFRVGKTGRPQYGGIKINAIRIDENSAATNTTGAGQGPRLSIFGSDNPTSVISVKGTNNYEDRVTDDDDIPNKAYVDLQLNNAQAEARAIVIGNTYLTVTDSSVDSVDSSIIAVLNGAPDMIDGIPNERTNVTTGTVVMRLTENIAAFQGVQFVGNQIAATGVNSNLVLTTNGTGQIILDAPLLFTSGNIPTPAAGETGLYVGTKGGGGTGVFFIQTDLQGDTTQDEFVSRKKALIYSIIFG
jgi:hypothetical protein